MGKYGRYDSVKIEEPSSFREQLVRCKCSHRSIIHNNKVGVCEQGYCFCKKFEQGEIKIWDDREHYIKGERRYEGGLF